MRVFASVEATTAKVTRRFHIIEDHPVVMTYSGEKYMRCESGTITYTLVGDDDWVVENSYQINVTGTVLKKDGSDSRVEHERSPDTVSFRGTTMTESWQWMQPVIDLLRPVGSLHMDVLEGSGVKL